MMMMFVAKMEGVIDKTIIIESVNGNNEKID